MNAEHASLWASAVAAFAAGDMATTMAGLDAGATEAHPVSAGLMDEFGPLETMAAAKAVVVVVAVAGYVYARRHPETQEWAEIFPLALLVLGLGIVSHNLDVIEEAEA